MEERRMEDGEQRTEERTGPRDTEDEKEVSVLVSLGAGAVNVEGVSSPELLEDTLLSLLDLWPPEAE